MSRYIDADDLKEAFEEVYPLATNEMGGAVNKRIYDIVDNAPTVFTQEDIDNILELAYISGQQHPERPKGKWITYSDYPGRLKCPNCNHRYDAWFIDNGDFCPNCGSDNGGDV